MTIHHINVAFQTRVQRSTRVIEVAEAFGLGLEDRSFELFKDLQIELNQGDVVYINGQSGSGKSVLLRQLAAAEEAAGRKVISIDEVEIDMDRPLIDQIGKDMKTAINLLSLAGISDAYLYIRCPKELSDGQRYRFRLAKLVETNADVWVADEFGAVLDRVTAKVVAYNMQKVARSNKKTLMIATTHEDLVEELGPDLTIKKRFQDRVTVDRRVIPAEVPNA